MSLGQGTNFSPNLDPQFQKYLELLKKWNKVYNLTAITGDEEIVVKHFEDSLSPLSLLPQSGRLLDIGCGGGFPGIPLKIVRPDLEIVLLDSVFKKIQFCEAVIRELKLTGIRAVQGRAENQKIIEQLGLFDVVVCRAAFSIIEFLKMAEKYLKRSGCAIAMKGPEWEKESKPEENWELAEIKNYELRNNLGKRTLLLFKNKNFHPQ
ncbi:MAG: 16S rRNA (guanine(527)-N(7))-methyltransferase RsmG [Deltaproteobacteria bacterium]|nr:16S rRNA (guanine(527)-N(7))-methyltransferase RsmG [Deltaproteobacteria bacterium]